MTCQNCVRHVRRALDAMSGVEIKAVEIGHADLLIDPATTSEAMIGKTLAEAGYAVASGPNLTQIQ